MIGGPCRCIENKENREMRREGEREGGNEGERPRDHETERDTEKPIETDHEFVCLLSKRPRQQH